MTIESMDRMFLPVGQGAFYCERFYNEGKGSVLNVVYDCGTRSGMKPLERAVDRYFGDSPIIHAVFISHLDEDHFNGLRYLVEKCTIERVFLPHMSPLDLRLMQLYHETHKDTLAANSQSKETNFVEEVLKCENMKDLEKKLQHFLNRPKLQRDDKQRLDIEDDGRPRPKIVYVGEGNHVKEKISSLIPGVNGGFSDWKYKAFCIRNDKAVAHVKPALRKLASHILKRTVKRLTPKTVAKLIKESKANAKFQDSIRKAYSAIGDFNTNSLVLYSGCDNTNATLNVSMCSVLFIPSFPYDRFALFSYHDSDSNADPYLSPFTTISNKVGCLYTGDFNAQNHLSDLQNYFKNERNTIGCIQIPHHGAEESYNDDFLKEDIPWHVISAGLGNIYKHPSSQVLNKYYNEKKPFPIVVTQEPRSIVGWHIYHN